MKNINEYFLIFKSKYVLVHVTDKMLNINNLVWILWSTEPGKGFGWKYFIWNVIPVNKNEWYRGKKEEGKGIIQVIAVEWRANVLGSLEKHIGVECLSKAAYLKNKKQELVSTVFTPPGLTHYPPGALTDQQLVLWEPESALGRRGKMNVTCLLEVGCREQEHFSALLQQQH